MARVRRVDGTRTAPLTEGWQAAATASGRISDPSSLDAERLDWYPSSAPSTAAAVLRAASRWSLDDRRDFDQDDWWWRCTFPASEGADAARVLHFGGLASLAEVWLNGKRILSSRNMFAEHEVPVDAILERDNELVIAFRSVAAETKTRRPRPRWRTRLVEAQQLRWIRTTLFGRIPAWTPAAAPVGPWRVVRLEERGRIASLRCDVRARTDGDGGVVSVEIALVTRTGRPPDDVTLHVGDASARLEAFAGDPGGIVARGSLRLDRVDRWWPHTHGIPHKYPVGLTVAGDGQPTTVDLGSVGFRDVIRDGGADGFGLRINGVEVFCRGACWTTLDPVTLTGPPESYRATLEAVRSAGMNMVRVSGPFFYEDDAFYDACDELGILVWQDYAFANMDYPGDDPDFVAEVSREARGFLDRTQTSSCLAVLCGNSEVEQQAAMIGAPRAIWRSPLFTRTLADASADLRPDVLYWPSTPSGGVLPFVSDAGTAHYFGVGAYMRPLDDARRAGVTFATECLAFANVPETALVDQLLGQGGTPPQDPRWKARVPRDRATGWDFEDVRDHYLRTLFRVDPADLRYSDVGRYLSMSRVATGEVMAATFSEWRRAGSSCKGALVWFLRDVWPGAGWGVLDAAGRPKAAYYALRRVLQPLALLLIDEGLNGLDAHVVNDGEATFEGELRFEAFLGATPVLAEKARVQVGGRSTKKVRIAGMLEHFADVTYAYRFGPPAHDVAVATLVDSSGALRGEAFHFPRGLPSGTDVDVGLEAVASPAGDGAWKATLRARRPALWVELDLRNFEPDDNYFHVMPGEPREVTLRAAHGASQPQGTALALNARVGSKLLIRQ